MKASIFGKKKDIYFMQEALKQAQKAAEKDEVPIGAVIVNKNGQIIARGYNQVEKKHTQTAHAEMTAITKAGKKMDDWRLENCWIYITLEPCAMCMVLIRLSRMKGVVFGADSPLFGYRLDKMLQLPVYKKDTFIVITGVLSNEAAILLKKFFKKKRKKL